MVDVIDVSYRLVQVKQQKYVCRCGGCIETALGPERAIPGSRYSLAFAVKVVLDKWLDHIPLERRFESSAGMGSSCRRRRSGISRIRSRSGSPSSAMRCSRT